jgi:2-dehydropantoate 2-reductase
VIVFGAGAVGGLVGALMTEAGVDVVLVARGAHAEQMARHGLTVESADSTRSIDVEVVTDVADARPGPGDTVLLAVKSQDTAAGLGSLRAAAPAGVVVACLQNGVSNEREALRLFADVYGICVICPATHLEPGVVEQNCSPLPGILDLGRYPAGTDERSAALAESISAAGFESLERPDIMAWKYRKLLLNLGNASDALLEPSAGRRVHASAAAEGEACLAAAGIDVVSAAADAERREGRILLKPIAGRERAGGSSWQSLQRGVGSIESDHLNGEIVLLGRLHGVPTPVNALLQRLAADAARERREPRSMSGEEFDRLLATAAAGPMP